MSPAAGRIGIRVLTQQTQRYLISSTSIPRGSIFQRQHSSRQFSSSNRSDNSIMVNEHHVKSYEEFTALVESLESSGQPVHCLFTGGKDESGLSWCPYCNTAAPVVKDGLQHAAPDSHFVYVDVGERSFWKDPNCPYRKDPRTHLVFLPTLLRWKSPQRLDGSKVAEADLVEMLFADED